MNGLTPEPKLAAECAADAKRLVAAWRDQLTNDGIDPANVMHCCGRSGLLTRTLDMSSGST